MADDHRDALADTWTELENARPAYATAEDMYTGRVGEIYASEKIRMLLRRAGVSKIEEFNYAHLVVDTVAHRLEITSVAIASDDVAEPDEPDNEPDETQGKGDGKAPKAADTKTPDKTGAQKALDDLWRANQLDAESDSLHLALCRDGDAYLIVWPRTDINDKIAAVDIRVNTAATVRAVYDDEDPLKMRACIKSWTYDEPDGRGGKTSRTRATMYYDDRVERWISRPGKMVLGSAESWQPYTGDGDPAVIKHDYGMPVFHFRNGRPYGKPEHLHAYGPQQLINKLVLAQAVSVDYQSFPQRYILMDPGQDQPMGNLLDPNHPDDDDDPEGSGNTSQLSAEASAVWRLWGAKSAGEWAGAPSDTFMRPFDRFVQAMGELTETPLYRFGSNFAQTPSGEALRAADAPTVNKVEHLQASLDAVWEDALEYALRLLGHKNVEVRVGWKPAEQASDSEAWTIVQAKIGAGMPRDQALIEAGYTRDQVDDWLRSGEAQNAAMSRRVELLTGVANALQAIGAAAAMGIVNEEQTASLVSDLLGGQPVTEPAGA
jgi:hypothetical protein